jgi:hypothetical protein
VELDYALLADSAQVANGKTYILGGGISILRRQQFPAPLGITLVVQLTYERTEAEQPHELRVVVMDADGNPILPELRASMTVGPPAEGIPRGVPLVAPIALGLPPVPVLQRPGSYQVQVLVDNRHLKTLPFAVVRLEQGQAPPA